MTRIEGNSPKVSFPTATPVYPTKLTYPRSSVWLSLAKIFADPVRVDKAMMREFRSNLASPPPLTSMEKTILEDAQKSVAALGEPHPTPPLTPRPLINPQLPQNPNGLTPPVRRATHYELPSPATSRTRNGAEQRAWFTPTSLTFLVFWAALS